MFIKTIISFLLGLLIKKVRPEDVARLHLTVAEERKHVAATEAATRTTSTTNSPETGCTSASDSGNVADSSESVPPQQSTEEDVTSSNQSGDTSAVGQAVDAVKTDTTDELQAPSNNVEITPKEGLSPAEVQVAPAVSFADQISEAFLRIVDEMSTLLTAGSSSADAKTAESPEIVKLVAIMNDTLEQYRDLGTIPTLFEYMSAYLPLSVLPFLSDAGQNSDNMSDTQALSTEVISKLSTDINSWSVEQKNQTYAFLTAVEAQILEIRKSSETQQDTQQSTGADSTAKAYEPSPEDLKKPLAAVSNILTWKWLGLVFFSFFIKSDKSCTGGVTEIVRKLKLDPACYKSMDDLFKSHAISLPILQHEWFLFVKENMPFFKIRGAICFTGDGVSSPKESRRMPGVVRIHKNSGTQSKPSSFHGIHTGNLGILTLGENHGVYNTVLTSGLMQGLAPMAEWNGTTHPYANDTLEIQELRDYFRYTEYFGRDSIYLTDRATMNNEAYEMVLAKDEELKVKGIHVMMITPARINVKAFYIRKPKEYAGSGPHTLKGDRVDFDALAKDEHGWKYRRLFLYGRKRKVRFKCFDLLWGEPNLKVLRFVICDMMNGSPAFVLTCTDLNMPAAEIIRAYALRFLCEESFRVLKCTYKAYKSHFWSKHMPKLSFFRKKGMPNLLESVTSSSDRQHIIDTIRATELYLMLAVIAMGISQYLAMQQPYNGVVHTYGKVREKQSRKVSEDTICTIITDTLPLIMAKYKDDKIIQMIQSKRANENYDELYDLL